MLEGTITMKKRFIESVVWVVIFLCSFWFSAQLGIGWQSQRESGEQFKHDLDMIVDFPTPRSERERGFDIGFEDGREDGRSAQHAKYGSHVDNYPPLKPVRR